ncbi:hypothetical protein A1D22_07565 [Pasteurellaceae bacterium LFhippo2]|nr:hypothetical protein [Pasteurellaceae bacterium LFhippo2]
MKNTQQIAKEVRWALWLTLFYILGWVGGAYFAPEGRGLIGFPIWFELSCIYMPILLVLLTTIVIKKVYKDIDLEESE